MAENNLYPPDAVLRSIWSNLYAYYAKPKVVVKYGCKGQTAPHGIVPNFTITGTNIPTLRFFELYQDFNLMPNKQRVLLVKTRSVRIFFSVIAYHCCLIIGAFLWSIVEKGRDHCLLLLKRSSLCECIAPRYVKEDDYCV